MNEQSETKSEGRTEKLKPFLQQTLQKILNFQATQNDFDLSDLSPLQLIIEEKDEGKKKLLLENDINSEEIISEMQEILSSDQHLHKCCVTVNRLAMWLDRFLAEVFRLTSSTMPESEKFNEFFDEFSNITYVEPFNAVVYSHIFNFNSDNNVLDFGDLKIQKLELQDRFRVLVDHSTLSLLHPNENLGTYFTISGSTDLIEDDWNWLINERIKAEDFIRIFQYFKNGVIHLNYSAVRFHPEWINPIRYGGVFFSGTQRRFPHEMGGKMYSINNDEYLEMAEWLNLYQLPDVVNKFDLETNEKNALGRRIELAGTYFEASHTQTELVRKLIDLAIALELIFHPHYQGEISFQISQLAAQLLGTNPSEKKEIFTDIKTMYQKRSDVFHGNLEQQDKKPITLEETEKWSDLIRKALLKLIVLYIRGEDDHKKITKLIKDSLLDPDDLKTLEQQSDISLLIAEFKEKPIHQS